ncbi:hypothetical protein FACS1894103_5700 [Campylobacterota bacterium]|nr:hypothetical protein FACS1894103_5700 [Campylobacterota bacterium]
MATRGSNTGYTANTAFGNQYKNDLVNAFGQAFLHIVNQKGFATTGPFTTFDDMTYPEKKDAYLAVVPSLNINFSDSGIGESKNSGLYYSKKGTLTLSGDFYIKVIEPLTNQAFINRRINLSDLKITRSYTYEVQTKTQGSDSADTMLMKMNAPAKLTNDTSKVMQEMLNEFYSQAVEKISAYLSREELLSLQTEIAKIKDLKRF